MSFRRLFIGFVVLFLVFVLDTGIWFITCQHLEGSWRKAVMAGRGHGFEGGAQSMHWSGWPFKAEVMLEQVGLRGSADAFPPNLVWSADRLRLQLSLRHPSQLQLLPEGTQSIQMAGFPKTAFSAASTRIMVDLTVTEPARLLVRDLEIVLPGGPVHVGEASLEFPPDSAIASLSQIALPGIAAPIEGFEGRFDIKPPFPREATSSASALAWRQSGGRLDIQRAQLRWDRLQVSLTGSGGLDSALQPEASGELVTDGLVEFLDHLVTLGAIPGPSAVAARAVLSVLSTSGDRAMLNLPLELHAGIISIARFPLLRLAPLVWN